METNNKAVVVMLPDNRVGSTLECLIPVFYSGVIAIRTRAESAHQVQQMLGKYNPRIAFINVRGCRGIGAGSIAAEQLEVPNALRAVLTVIQDANILEREHIERALQTQSGLAVKVRAVIHDRLNDLHRNRAIGPRSQFTSSLVGLKDDLHQVGLTNVANLVDEAIEISATESISNEDAAALKKILEDVQSQLAGDLRVTVETNVIDSMCPNCPPEGYGTILVADDEGCPPEWRISLEALGYGLEEVATLEDASHALRVNPAAVFVCDMQWGKNPLAGRDLLRLACHIKACKLKVGLSTANYRSEDIPEADWICSGANAKTADGVRDLHRKIWQWSTN